MPWTCWGWRRPRRPGCSGPDRPGSSPPRPAVGCCLVRSWRPTRADPGQRHAAPRAFGLADHVVITEEVEAGMAGRARHQDDRGARADRAREVGLFRYALIREAADPALSTRQR